MKVNCVMAATFLAVDSETDRKIRLHPSVKSIILTI